MQRTRKMQFGIGTVLILTACMAGYLSAYRFGIDELMAANQQKISTRSYDVSDFLSGVSSKAEAELVELQRLILATAGADTWHQGTLGIQPYHANRSLVITQTGAVHDKVQQLLADLRSHLKQAKSIAR